MRFISDRFNFTSSLKSLNNGNGKDEQFCILSFSHDDEPDRLILYKPCDTRKRARD